LKRECFSFRHSKGPGHNPPDVRQLGAIVPHADREFGQIATQQGLRGAGASDESGSVQSACEGDRADNFHRNAKRSLTGSRGGPYNAAIETAPPLSGASSALHWNVGPDAD